MEIKYLGVSDEVTTCQRCGKPNLKKTVVLDIDGSVEHIGSDCASRLLYGKTSASNKKMIERRATMAQYIANCQANNRSLDYICNGIWNKFGYGCEVRNGVLRVQFDGKIFEMAKEVA